MHPIPVRTMKFEVPSAGEFHPLCIAGNSVLSYNHMAFGLYVALLEPFAVKSFRRVLERIRDDGLREEVDRFSRQEAQHYQRHIDFNKAVLAHGYPGLEQRLDRLRDDLEGFLGKADDRFCIGYGKLESYTTQFALMMIESGRTTTSAPSAFGSLFKWHMLRRSNRNVAFDLQQHLYVGIWIGAHVLDIPGPHAALPGRLRGADVGDRRRAPRRALPHHGTAEAAARDISARHAPALHASRLHAAQAPRSGWHSEVVGAVHAAGAKRALAAALTRA